MVLLTPLKFTNILLSRKLIPSEYKFRIIILDIFVEYISEESNKKVFVPLLSIIIVLVYQKENW